MADQKMLLASLEQVSPVQFADRLCRMGSLYRVPLGWLPPGAAREAAALLTKTYWQALLDEALQSLISLHTVVGLLPMWGALISQIENLATDAAWEAPLSVVLQDVEALLVRLRTLTAEEATACERAALSACAELAVQAGRLASLSNSCPHLEGAAGLQLAMTELGEQCWRAVAACQVAWALFTALDRNCHVTNMSETTCSRLLANCSTTFGPACSLMQQLCCAAGELRQPVQRRVAASLAPAAEVVLTALGEALRHTEWLFKDVSAALAPAAFRPAALVSLLGDAMDIIQFVGTASGPAMRTWSTGVWRCLTLLLGSTGRRSARQQHYAAAVARGQKAVQQLRSLATTTHTSLFAEFSRKGFSEGWAKQYWQVLGVLGRCTFQSTKMQLVPQDDSTISERCGVLLGLLSQVGSSQDVLADAIHFAAGLSSACVVMLISATEPGAQPLSVAQLLLCLDACSLCAGTAMAAVELVNSETDGSRRGRQVSPAHNLGLMGDLHDFLIYPVHSWKAAGGGGSEALQLAASAAEAAECTLRLAGLLLRQGGSIEGCDSTTVACLLSFAVRMLHFVGKLGSSGGTFGQASCSVLVSAAKMVLTMLALPQARQVQWSLKGSMEHNHAATLLLSAGVECCTAAASAAEELQDSWRRQHDAAVLSLLYAGQHVALSSSTCKEDVQSLTGLLQLSVELARAPSLALLFHNLGGMGMVATACMRLLVRPRPKQAACLQKYDFAEFVSAQPALGSAARAVHESNRVGLFLGAELVSCGFLERLVCWVEKGLEMIGNTSKKMRTVLAELRNVVLACCASVAQEARSTSGQPAPASCEDSPSCRLQHAAWFEDAAEKQLCRAKMWARFSQETLPQLATSVAAVAKARQEAGAAGRELALQRAAAALQARACAHLGCTNLRGCCEGRLPARGQGEAGRFCSPECQAAAEGQLARLCNQAA